MQASRSDVLHALVHPRRHARQLGDPLGRELERGALGFHQRGVLLGERILRLRHDAHEVGFGERLELHPNGEAPLQLRNEIAWLAHVERAGRHEQNMVGLHRAVLGLHVGALDDGEQITLHTLPRHVGAASLTAFAGDLVDFVEEHDAHRFGTFQRIARDVVEVDELLEFLIEQNPTRLAHLHRAPLLLFGEHVAKPLGHALHAFGRAGHHGTGHPRAALRHLDLHLAAIELPVEQQRLELVARTLVPFERLIVLGARIG